MALVTETVGLVDASKVVRVYSGKPGCACGCKGKYTNRASVESRLADYQVNTNDRVVEQIVKKMNAVHGSASEVNVILNDEFTSVTLVGVRTYTAYYRV